MNVSEHGYLRHETNIVASCSSVQDMPRAQMLEPDSATSLGFCAHSNIKSASFVCQRGSDGWGAAVLGPPALYRSGGGARVS